VKLFEILLSSPNKIYENARTGICILDGTGIGSLLPVSETKLNHPPPFVW
jgi:hypothetical protein